MPQWLLGSAAARFCPGSIPGVRLYFKMKNWKKLTMEQRFLLTELALRVSVRMRGDLPSTIALIARAEMESVKPVTYVPCGHCPYLSTSFHESSVHARTHRHRKREYC